VKTCAEFEMIHKKSLKILIAKDDEFSYKFIELALEGQN